jgi:hypothetical protein
MAMAMHAVAQAALEIDTQNAMQIMACLPDTLPEGLAMLEYCKELLLEWHERDK